MVRTSLVFRFAMLALAFAELSIFAHAQLFTDLYNFGTLSNDPAVTGYPGIIAQGRDGNLYSTSSSGGANNLGSVFQVTPAGTLSVIYSFAGADGSTPQSGLTLGTDGDFYGTTFAGGASGNGVIFKITPGGTLTVLYQFSGAAPDGRGPYAAPIQGTDGNLYGTAFYGGTKGVGSVYKLTPTGVFTTLHYFRSTDGENPTSPLVQGSDGKLYGTTQSGGKYKSGTVFRVTTAGGFKVLRNFATTDGQLVIAPLIQASDGNLYGTAEGGGTVTDGTVFKITTAGVFSVLHDFVGSDGYSPTGGLVQASDGNFYGVTSGFGISGYGGAFSITPTGTFTVLTSAFGPTTGEEPEVTLVQHTNGILYGDTFTGGTGGTCRCGTFYSLNSQLPPYAALVPNSGKVGNTIGILGQGLTGTTAVSFHGTTAAYQVVSDTYLTATVPKGATTGPITVTTPAGPLVSQSFLVRLH